MNFDSISKVWIDDLGRVCVSPDRQKLPYIYREAMEVGWDAERNCLIAPPDPARVKLATADWWFHRILLAAREQGIYLRFAHDTATENIPPESRPRICRLGMVRLSVYYSVSLVLAVCAAFAALIVFSLDITDVTVHAYLQRIYISLGASVFVILTAAILAFSTIKRRWANLTNGTIHAGLLVALPVFFFYVSAALTLWRGESLFETSEKMLRNEIKVFQDRIPKR